MNLYEMKYALYEDSAFDLAEKAYGKPRDDLEIRFLFSGSSLEFATRPSDSGFIY